MAEQIKPCAACGEMPDWFNNGDGGECLLWCCCIEAGTMGPGHPSKQAAIQSWNRQMDRENVLSTSSAED